MSSKARRWPLVGGLSAVAILLAARAFVGNVYRVSTSSMRPTLAAGDGKSVHVAVLYGAPSPLERFDLCVFRQPGNSAPVVKRVVAFGGESIQIAGGDLYIDGARLPMEAPRPPEQVVFDSDLERVEELFHFKGHGCPGGEQGPWRMPEADGAGYRLEALDLSLGDNTARMFLVPDVTTSGLATSDRAPQWLQVGDLAVMAQLRILEAPLGAQAVIELREAADLFRASLVRTELGFEARLDRSASGAAFKPLARAELGPEEVALGQPVELRFRNRDDHLELFVNGARRVTASYSSNEPYVGTTPPGIDAVGPRLGVGGAGIVLEVEKLRLARDLHWASNSRFGEFATGRSLQLGPGEVFLLGDNTLDSTDSRFFGPIRMEDLTGRPVAVVWPPAEWTSL